jgi:hypothetical protein
MQISDLTPRTKEVLLKVFDHLETASYGKKSGAARFMRMQNINGEELRESMRLGKALILS